MEQLPSQEEVANPSVLRRLGRLTFRGIVAFGNAQLGISTKAFEQSSSDEPERTELWQPPND